MSSTPTQSSDPVCPSGQEQNSASFDDESSRLTNIHNNFFSNERPECSFKLDLTHNHTQPDLFSPPSTSVEITPSFGFSFDSHSSDTALEINTLGPYDIAAYHSISSSTEVPMVGLGIQGLYKEGGSSFDGLGVLSYREHSTMASGPSEASFSFSEPFPKSTICSWGWAVENPETGAQSSDLMKPVKPGMTLRGTSRESRACGHSRSKSRFENTPLWHISEMAFPARIKSERNDMTASIPAHAAEANFNDASNPSPTSCFIPTQRKSIKTVRSRKQPIFPIPLSRDDVFYSGKTFVGNTIQSAEDMDKLF